jgi:hypothetical protein
MASPSGWLRAILVVYFGATVVIGGVLAPDHGMRAECGQ